MKRYLVVANRTLGGPELVTAIRERAASGPAHFHVLVPNTPPEHGPSRVGGLGTSAGGQGGGVFLSPAAVGEPESQAYSRDVRHRLDEMYRHVTEAGAEVDGEVGDADPYAAIKDVLRGAHFDEIILSTLPTKRNRMWGRDLPHRVQRLFEGPVTVIESTN